MVSMNRVAATKEIYHQINDNIHMVHKLTFNISKQILPPSSTLG